jgi:hypothetical protein
MVDLGVVPGITSNKAIFGRFRKSTTGWSIDGVNTTTPSDSSMPIGPFNAFVGSASAGTAFFKGDIAELKVYNTVLSDSECASIKSALKTKWGLP